MGDRICKGCSAVIIPGPRERRKREWCEQACRQRQLRASDAWKAAKPERDARRMARAAERRGNCPFCAAPLPPGYRSACPANECQKKRAAAYAREQYALNPEPHRKRVAEYREKLDPAIAAAEREKWRAWLEENRDSDQFRLARQASDARRRARKRGATVERFKHQEIFDRDNWRCGICGESIDSALKYPDPMSVSLDHIVPLARGGDHSRENTRASHLRCNVVRHVGRNESAA